MAAKSAFKNLVFPELFCPIMTVSGSSSTSTERRQRNCRIRASLMNIPLDAGPGLGFLFDAMCLVGALTAAMLLRLEVAIARELQCSAVLRHRTHDVVRSA